MHTINDWSIFLSIISVLLGIISIMITIQYKKLSDKNDAWVRNLTNILHSKSLQTHIQTRDIRRSIRLLITHLEIKTPLEITKSSLTVTVTKEYKKEYIEKVKEIINSFELIKSTFSQNIISRIENHTEPFQHKLYGKHLFSLDDIKQIIDINQKLLEFGIYFDIIDN